jgi:hypothetical protein
MKENLSSVQNPHAEYTGRLAYFEETIQRWHRRERTLSYSRLLAFGITLVLLWLAFGVGSVSLRWPGISALLFIGLVIGHDYVIRKRRAADRSAAFYRHGLARLEDRWHGLGETGENYRDRDHLYADDLDIFGEGSVFQLLCTARTPTGKNTLARWLLSPAPAEEVCQRQDAVRELRDRLRLREDIAQIGEELGAQFDPDALSRWAQEDSTLTPSRGLRLGIACVCGLTIGALVLWAITPIGPLPFAFALALQGSISLLLRKKVRPLINNIAQPTRNLTLLRDLLRRLEAESYSGTQLTELSQKLECEGTQASARITQLERLTHLLDARHNQLFAPIGALLLWGTQVSLAIASWQQQWGNQVAIWVEAAGDLEALNSLAAYHYEHPDDPFPTISRRSDATLFEGKALGHPLIPGDDCARNDLTLQRHPQMLLVSGSNMSGKSTLLRTVGVNTVLALAGCTVRAERLGVSELNVTASIQVHDSLAEGKSRFYAEILRLRQILDQSEGEAPVLFLLDEVLHGTNSHDRRIGAEAIVRELLARNAVGLVTTHDLALAKITDELAPRVENFPFEDQLEEGEIHFDYRLRKGVVTKSNALDLMRAVGLRV